MKTAIIYYSQTGFTKRYAEWIAEAINADCLKLQKAKKEDLSVYEAIVFGSWIRSENICNLNWFENNLKKWSDKKMILFCVGGSPLNSPKVKIMLKKISNKLEPYNVSIFYCPGGFNYQKMNLSSRIMMKIFLQSLKIKKYITHEDSKLFKIISSYYDISDKKYVEPILKSLKG